MTMHAAEAGASGIGVSTTADASSTPHRPPSMSCLEIADTLSARGHRIEVLMDGDVRRGTDIEKALALGARAVLVGRPIL